MDAYLRILSRERAGKKKNNAMKVPKAPRYTLHGVVSCTAILQALQVLPVLLSSAQ
jgi:hypothetical protein